MKWEPTPEQMQVLQPILTKADEVERLTGRRPNCAYVHPEDWTAGVVDLNGLWVIPNSMMPRGTVAVTFREETPYPMLPWP